jgi:formylglycine-generating enzyme required for sulfatase activity
MLGEFWRQQVRSLCLVAMAVVAEGAAAQDALTSFLALKLVSPLAPQLTIYGYPGSTNQVECANALGSTDPWKVVTNVVLTNSSSVLFHTSPPPGEQRFYRVSVTGATRPVAPSNYVWIPPGRFLMGSPVTEQDRNYDESPQMVVTLTRGFYMGRYLVTQGEFLEVMGYNPSWFVGDTNRPVESAGWFGATNYCGTLTLREQQAGRLPATWCYRLPTEAEWEYACRAGTTTRFSYGDDPGYTHLTDYAWYDRNSGSTNKPPGASYVVWGVYYTTHPVGQKLPNPWGLYDMYGEVYEWCQDWYGRYPGGSPIDPQGWATGTERVIRSASWLDDPKYLRSASRYAVEPDNVSGIFGFRVVLAPVQP